MPTSVTHLLNQFIPVHSTEQELKTVPSALYIIFKNIITCDMLNSYGIQGLKNLVNHNKKKDHKTPQIVYKHGPDQLADELQVSAKPNHY